MTNTEAWDRIAERATTPTPTPDLVHYGPDGPTDRGLRFLGEVAGLRILDLGCGSGANAVALARRGASVIALDTSAGQLRRARERAAAADVRLEWHQRDAAELAFLRADSFDLVLTTWVIDEVEDLSRLLRQAHRVLKPGGVLVASHRHPFALCCDRAAAGSEVADGEGTVAEAGTLPLGDLVVRRSYFDAYPTKADVDGESITVRPRSVSEVFTSMGRAGFRVEAIAEPGPTGGSEPHPMLPAALVWRARKEGV